MGILVKYELKLVIKKGKKELALAAINELHSLESLKKYNPRAKVKTLDEVRKKISYSWAKHPEDEKFETLDDAFDAWELTEIDCKSKNNKDGTWTYQGKFSNKLGDQEIFLQAISPFCEDFCINVKVVEWNDGRCFSWINRNGIFRSTL